MWPFNVERWRDLVLDELRLAGSHLDAELVLALISQESGGDPNAAVERGARATGLMQVTTAGKHPSLEFYNQRSGASITPDVFAADARLQIRVGTWLLDHYRNQVDVQLFANRRATTPVAQLNRAQLADHAYAEGMGTLIKAIKEWRDATFRITTPTSAELQALHPSDPPPWAVNHVWRHRDRVVGKAAINIAAAGRALTWSPRSGAAVVPTPPEPVPVPVPKPDPVPPPLPPVEKKNSALLIGGIALGVVGVAALGWGVAHV